MINLNRETVMAELDKAVNVKGEDYVYTDEYPQCKYIQAGGAGCLVGHVLLNLGVSVDRLIEADNYEGGGGMDAGMLLDELELENVVKFDPASREALTWAQVKQDAGNTWGAALRAAEQEYGNSRRIAAGMDDF